MAMTAARSEASQWPGYASWLPLVAEQISAINGAAFGRRGIMAQNLKNSTTYAEAARQYRDWSERNWQQVTDDRNASVDRRAFQVRENLGAVQTYVNPFGTSTSVQLPTTYKYYWSDNQGNYLGSDDPSVQSEHGLHDRMEADVAVPSVTPPYSFTFVEAVRALVDWQHLTT